MQGNRFYSEFDTANLDSTPAPNLEDHRNPFQIDRDRILFSPPFRRLQSKTQVFQTGEFDFYRTRLTHTIEVARIARSIAEFLKHNSPHLEDHFTIDGDLVEAVGLAHDLGHPPFGHIGERKLHQLMQSHGGFEGNAQTLRILTKLIYSRRNKPLGMAATRALLDGVLKYKTLHREFIDNGQAPLNHFIYDSQVDIRNFVFPDPNLRPDSPETWNQTKSIECQIMDWADDTAYSLHDIVDGIAAGFITPSRIERWAEAHSPNPADCTVVENLLHSLHDGYYEPRMGKRVGKYIRGCQLKPFDQPNTPSVPRYQFLLQVDPQLTAECRVHKQIAVDLIFRSPPLQQIEFKGGRILEKLFSALAEHYHLQNPSPLRILPPPYSVWIQNIDDENARYRLFADFLSALTDGEATRLYRRLFEPSFGPLNENV